MVVFAAAAAAAGEDVGPFQCCCAGDSAVDYYEILSLTARVHDMMVHWSFPWVAMAADCL